MSIFKQRSASKNLLANPLHPVPADDPGNAPVNDPRAPQAPAPPSSASVRHQRRTPSPALTPPAAAREADLVCLADIEPRPVDWLWKDRLAAGALSVLSGDPGSGKTWVALAIAAALSRGREPAVPSDSSSGTDPCTCLYASTGNAAAELLRPRFADLEGDPARLFLLRGALAANSAQTAPRPAALTLRDLPMLEDSLQRTQARLLIIDALHSFLGPGAHRVNDAGRTFDNLARLAENHGCCILLVRHVPRRERGLLPVELSAAVRTEFLSGSSPDAPDYRALVQVKSNLGCLAPSLEYFIDDTGSFSWTGPSSLTPQELTDRPVGAGLPLRKVAAGWLTDHLGKGHRSQYDVESAARRDGISIATLRRAKFDVGVVSIKQSVSGYWIWALPEDEWLANPSLSKAV